MKTYRELTFKGTAEQLMQFSKEIREYAKGDWALLPAKERFKDYLQFSYRGTFLENAHSANNHGCLYPGISEIPPGVWT